MSDVELAILGFVLLFTSAFSSIAGAGGGFIVTPLMIFMGLSPQQAIATGKFMGLSLVVSNIRVMNKQKLHSWNIVLPLMAIAVVIGLIAPHLITKIEGDVYQKIIGVLILSMVPVMHFKKLGRVKKKITEGQKVLGYMTMAVVLSLQGIFSGGLGALVNVTLVSLFGMGALEASITKRFTQLLLNGLIIIGLIGSGLFVWKVVVVGVIANFIGGTIGSHIAIKKGNAYVMTIMKIAMIVSGVSLLVI